MPCAEIVWIEAAGDYSLLHLSDRELTVRMPLKSLETELPALFVRVHRSAIISTAQIREISFLPKGEAMIALMNGARVRTSRSYRDIVQGLADDDRVISRH